MWLLADTFCSYRIAMHLHMGPFEDTIIMKETCFFLGGGYFYQRSYLNPGWLGFEARECYLCAISPPPPKRQYFLKVCTARDSNMLPFAYPLSCALDRFGYFSNSAINVTEMS